VDPGVALAVTTRSRLKSVRFFPSMLRASLRIRKQLDASPGCVRFSTIVMGPRDLWTITIWRTRHEMLDFMRSGAHEDIMWDFSRWLESFWLMRWKPSAEESGVWDGMTLGARGTPDEPVVARTPEQQAALDAALASIPRLRAASGPSGAASLTNAPHQRRAHRMVAGAVGGTMRLEVPTYREGPSAWRSLARLHSSLNDSEDGLRSAFGVADARTFYLLAVLRNEDAWRSLQATELMDDIRRRWPAGMWTMRWDAENEFGHWDGLRLRKVKLGTKVTIPKAVEAAVKTED